MKKVNLIILLFSIILFSHSTYINKANSSSVKIVAKHQISRSIASWDLIAPSFFLKGDDITKYCKIIVRIKYSNYPEKSTSFDPQNDNFNITKGRKFEFNLDDSLSENKKRNYQYQIEAGLALGQFPDVQKRHYKSEWITSSKNKNIITSSDWQGPGSERKITFNIIVKKEGNIKSQKVLITLSWKDKNGSSSKMCKIKKFGTFPCSILTDNHSTDLIVTIKIRKRIKYKDGKKKYHKKKFIKRIDSKKMFTIEL